MTRWPAFGRCKSRLSKEIGSNLARSIQERLTFHTFAVANTLAKKGIFDIRLAVSGIAAKAAYRWAKNLEVQSIALQGNGSLGTKMRRQVLKAQRNFHNEVSTRKKLLLIGTDLPSLNQRDLIEALEALNHNDIVLGPSPDGGYWLIGLSDKLIKPVAKWPFSGIPWGSNQVLYKTIKNAELKNAKYQLLNIKNDLDLIQDLNPWIIV